MDVRVGHWTVRLSPHGIETSFTLYVGETALIVKGNFFGHRSWVEVNQQPVPGFEKGDDENGELPF